MSLGLGIAIGGIAIGIGLYLVSRAINSSNGIKNHEIFYYKYGEESSVKSYSKLVSIRRCERVKLNAYM